MLILPWNSYDIILILTWIETREIQPHPHKVVLVLSLHISTFYTTEGTNLHGLYNLICPVCMGNMCKSVCIGVGLLLGLMAYAALHAYLYSLSHHGVSSMRRWTCPLCGNLDHHNTPKFRVQWQWIWRHVLKKNINILVFAGIWTHKLKLKYHTKGQTTRSGDIPNSNIWNPV
jgi:hypothetical protein